MKLKKLLTRVFHTATLVLATMLPSPLQAQENDGSDVPVADLLDLVINADGTVADQSAMANEIKVYGNVEVALSSRYGTYSYLSKHDGSHAVNFLKVDYSNNQALKDALTAGYSMEVLFKLNSASSSTMKPVGATEGGGFCIETSGSRAIQTSVNTTVGGTNGYRVNTSSVVLMPDEYYHVVVIYKGDQTLTMYVNGANRNEVAAPGKLHFPDNPAAQWVGIGADPTANADEGQSFADFEFVNVRFYSQALSEEQVRALYFDREQATDYLGIAQAFAQSDEVTRYGGAALTEEYLACIEAYKNLASPEDFPAAFEAEQAARQALQASVQAYKNFETAIEQIRTYLDEHQDFSSPLRTFIENEYLGTIAPGMDNRAPYGGIGYIMENRQLTADELTAEATRAQEMLSQANTNMPEADLLDLVFLSGGDVTDQSAMGNEVKIYGDVEVEWSERYGTFSYLSKFDGNNRAVNFLKIDYSNNQALKNALTTGYTLEALFRLRSANVAGKPIGATEGGGFCIEYSGDKLIQTSINTTVNGANGYRVNTSKVRLVPGEYYHVVIVYQGGKSLTMLINGDNRNEVAAPGILHFPDNVDAQWVGIGADPTSNPDKGEAFADYEFVNVRFYSQPLTEEQAKRLYYTNEQNTDYLGMAEAFALSDDVEKYGGVALTEEYMACIEAYGDVTNLDEFAAAFQAEKAARQALEASIQAYKNYEAAILEIQTYLEENPNFSGDDRDFLEGEYLGGLEPGDDNRAPNGGYEYIMEMRTLTAGEVTQEAERARELLRIAVANGFEAGTDITNMLTNAGFTDGLNGWQGVKFTGSGRDTREGGTLCSAEIWSATAHNMWQEIVADRDGVYELQMRGGYRPFDQANAIQYYPYIYINGNANYLQCIVEDMIPIAEAEDQVNCHLTEGQTPDCAITNIDGDTIGWAIHGVQSCNVAFAAGRYDNRILVQAQKGDVIRIGICQPYSGFGGNEWVGVGDIHLTYAGTMAQAEQAIDRVLASQLARANALQQIEFRSDADYVMYPAYSQELRQRLAAAIEAAAVAQDNEAKYAVICNLSQIFREIAECKKAYVEFFRQVDEAYSIAFTAAELDPNCADLGNQAEAMMSEAMQAYEEGSLTVEEALKADIVNNLGVYPTQDNQGVYHIANTAQYCQWAEYVNRNATADNGFKTDVVLEGDVCVNASIIVKHFTGTFDGQDHTMQLAIESTGGGAAPFNALRGATVKNLILRGTIATSYKNAGSLASHSYEAGGHGTTIDRIQSFVDISTTLNGDGTHGGIVGIVDKGAITITNSLFAGSIGGENTHSSGGLIGWAGGTSAQMDNCLVIAKFNTNEESCNTFARGNANTRHCVYATPYGTTPDECTQASAEDLQSGHAAYILNGQVSRGDVAWRQNLGEDLVPTLDTTHSVVFKAADGTFTNDAQSEMQKHAGTEGDPLLIGTAEEMAMLRSMLVPGRVNYVQLTADIDMSGITNWYPLNMVEDKAGSLEYQNIIHFNGQNHVIRNFTALNAEQAYNSFFGILCGDVCNVGFENAQVACTASGTGILAGYIGHDQFVASNETKLTSTLTNVWATGKLTTGTGYTGGLVGNIGGPSILTNVYTHIAIESQGTDNFVGGIVGRVRDHLNITQAYAAGTITCQSPNVGGITGGGFQENTTPGYYENIVVWYNDSQNFGPTKPAEAETTMPQADIFDLQVNEDGTVADRSAMSNVLDVHGKVNVRFSPEYNTWSYLTKANGTTGVDYIRLDYSGNQAFKDAITAGFTMEAIFKLNGGNNLGRKPMGATQGGGWCFEPGSHGTVQASINTNNNGSIGYRVVTSDVTIKSGEYYHAILVYRAGETLTLYVNGGHKTEVAAPGKVNFPAAPVSQWLGIGCDPTGNVGGSEAAGDFEFAAARIYSKPMTEAQAKQLYLQRQGIDALNGDQLNGISYFDGTNFAALQQTVVGWGEPWKCGMAEGEYPTFGGTIEDGIHDVNIVTKGTIYHINGIQVEKTTRGLYIIDGKKVMVK